MKSGIIDSNNSKVGFYYISYIIFFILSFSFNSIELKKNTATNCNMIKYLNLTRFLCVGCCCCCYYYIGNFITPINQKLAIYNYE